VYVCGGRAFDGAGDYNYVRVVLVVPAAEQALAAPLRKTTTLQEGLLLIWKKEFLACKRLVGVDTVPHLGDMLRKTVGTVDAWPLSDRFIAGRKIQVVMSFPNHR